MCINKERGLKCSCSVVTLSQQQNFIVYYCFSLIEIVFQIKVKFISFTEDCFINMYIHCVFHQSKLLIITIGLFTQKKYVVLFTVVVIVNIQNCYIFLVKLNLIENGACIQYWFFVLHIAENSASMLYNAVVSWYLVFMENCSTS